MCDTCDVVAELSSNLAIRHRDRVELHDGDARMCLSHHHIRDYTHDVLLIGMLRQSSAERTGKLDPERVDAVRRMFLMMVDGFLPEDTDTEISIATRELIQCLVTIGATGTEIAAARERLT
jgi:hypothetical protein